MDDLIERIRRYIEEVGDCWEWMGAMQGRSITPVMRYHQRTSQVRRFIAEAQGKDLSNAKLLATCSCRNPRCVNPEHVVVMTRKRFQELICRETDYSSSLVRNKKLADAARVRFARISPEVVAQIRDAQGVQKQIAKDFGVSQSTVSSIKRGETWKEYSSPFAGLFGGKK